MSEQRPKRIIFIGGLHPSTTEERVAGYFSQFTKITKVEVVKHRRTGTSKGYCYLKVEDGEETCKILDVCHYLDGRKLDCQLAANRKEKKHCKELQNERMIYITNLNDECTSEDVLTYFRTISEVRNAYVIQDCQTLKSKRFGYVEFLDHETAQKFYSRDVIIGSSNIKCLKYTGREPKKPIEKPQKAPSKKGEAVRLSNVLSTKHLSGEEEFKPKGAENKTPNEYEQLERPKQLTHGGLQSRCMHHRYYYLTSDCSMEQYDNNYRYNILYADSNDNSRHIIYHHDIHNNISISHIGDYRTSDHHISS